MDPEDQTVPLDEAFAETVEHCGRTYQSYAVTNGTYFAPVDQVGGQVSASHRDSD
jgi:hypothetical protein